MGAVRLPAETVTALAASLRADPAGGLLEVWRAVELEWDSLEVVKPWEYQFEAGVGATLCQAAIDGGGGLLWLNSAPSTAAAS